jgi:hypothetical protein
MNQLKVNPSRKTSAKLNNPAMMVLAQRLTVWKNLSDFPSSGQRLGCRTNGK